MSNWEKVRTALEELKRKRPGRYHTLIEEYRDILPHTGEYDVMLGSAKFREWVENQDSEEIDYLLDEINKDTDARLFMVNYFYGKG